MANASFGASGLQHAQTDWVRAHEALSRLARERAAADAEEGRWLLAALRSAAHVHLGFGSFAEYVERLFGYKPRSTQEKLRVAEALEGLPAIAQALEGGSRSTGLAPVSSPESRSPKPSVSGSRSPTERPYTSSKPS